MNIIKKSLLGVVSIGVIAAIVISCVAHANKTTVTVTVTKPSNMDKLYVLYQAWGCFGAHDGHPRICHKFQLFKGDTSNSISYSFPKGTSDKKVFIIYYTRPQEVKRTDGYTDKVYYKYEAQHKVTSPNIHHLNRNNFQKVKTYRECINCPRGPILL